MTVHIFIDGASRGNPGPASIGVLLLDTAGGTLKEYGRRIGEATNNVAEYTALLEALRLAKELGASVLKVHSDSQLLVRQFNGDYRVKSAHLLDYLKRIMKLRGDFKSVELLHVPREQNRRADRLANRALDEVPLP